MKAIRIGIVGYGNLGKGVELAVLNSKDMELIGIFTRRDKVETLSGHANTMDKLPLYKDNIDVMILCGGSATDLPEQGKEILKDFNTVDSFDTHGKIPEYFSEMDKIGKDNGNLSIMSVGWDPGLMSLARLLFTAVLPNGKDYTFWGKGVSQGHSDAIRRIKGVMDARQYTIPIEQAVEKVRSGLNPELTTRQKHIRECYVVAEDGADKEYIRQQIITMPYYFADYDTVVYYITKEEMQLKHSGLPHGGSVLRSGNTYSDNKHVLEFKLNLDSNPEFTGSVMVAYARALYRMYEEGRRGCLTVFDVPFGLLSPDSAEELRKNML